MENINIEEPQMIDFEMENNKVDLKQFVKDYHEILNGNFEGKVSDILPIVKQNKFKELLEQTKKSDEKFKDINMENILEYSPLYIIMLLTFISSDTVLKI